MNAMTQIKQPNFDSQDNASVAPQAELWARLSAFELDVPEHGLTFTERLARDNAWSMAYARRVTQEYKRFVFLAATCGHIVCPSDAVDQVWHMHLTYTRSYWDDLCGSVLNSPLHHGPTRGGNQEREKYFRLYEKTIASYQAHFGSRPPADIWPAAEQRFGSDLHFIRINTRENYVVPRFRFTRRNVRNASVGAASVGLLFPLAQLALNPLQWTGPQFLILFAGLLVAAIVVCIIARFQVSFPTDSDSLELGQLEPMDVAWMQGGNARAVSCGLLELAQAEAIDTDGPRVRAGKNIDTVRPSHRVSELILQGVKSAADGASWAALSRGAQSGLVQVSQKLEGLGLVKSSSQRRAAATMPLLLIGAVLTLGAAKIFVGLSRSRPVGFLVVAEVVAIVALVLFLASIPKLTDKGKRFIEKIRRQVDSGTLAAAQPTGDSAAHPEMLAAADPTLMWSAALLGTGVLASTPYAPYHNLALQNSASTAASGGSGIGCGGDAGGGDGGGGGCGGGCGGCGGCGG